MDFTFRKGIWMYPSWNVTLLLLVQLCCSKGFGQCTPNYDFGGETVGSFPESGDAFLQAFVGTDYIDIWHLIVPSIANYNPHT